MDTDNLNALIERVIGAAIEVSNVLGPGFLEKVYERALLKELASRGIEARAQVGLPVSTKDNWWVSTLQTSWLKANL